MNPFILLILLWTLFFFYMKKSRLDHAGIRGTWLTSNGCIEFLSLLNLIPGTVLTVFFLMKKAKLFRATSHRRRRRRWVIEWNWINWKSFQRAKKFSSLTGTFSSSSLAESKWRISQEKAFMHAKCLTLIYFKDSTPFKTFNLSLQNENISQIFLLMMSVGPFLPLGRPSNWSTFQDLPTTTSRICRHWIFRLEKEYSWELNDFFYRSQEAVFCIDDYRVLSWYLSRSFSLDGYSANWNSSVCILPFSDGFWCSYSVIGQIFGPFSSFFLHQNGLWEINQSTKLFAISFTFFRCVLPPCVFFVEQAINSGIESFTSMYRFACLL